MLRPSVVIAVLRLIPYPFWKKVNCPICIKRRHSKKRKIKVGPKAGRKAPGENK